MSLAGAIVLSAVSVIGGMIWGWFLGLKSGYDSGYYACLVEVHAEQDEAFKQPEVQEEA